MEGEIKVTTDPSSDKAVNAELKDSLRKPAKVEDTEIQVKFTVNDSVNGQNECLAKSAISSFSGLSKDELLKFANDPFWIRVRLFLFVGFWLIWLAMFVSAVGIIIMVPKCETLKKPEWFEQGPFYEVDIEKFIENTGPGSLLQGMKTKLDYLSNLHIKGIILSPIFKINGKNEENVVDFKLIDEKFGTMDDFNEMILEAKKKHINIILTFAPNHCSISHDWFRKSLAKVPPFNDYFIWAPSSGTSSDGVPLPPNNWLSVTGGSAWEWVEERQEFYLHQFDIDQPDLNFHNTKVLQEFADIFSYWINLGVKGFNMDKVQYLLEDRKLQDEIANGKPGAIHTQYEFYSHVKTHNIPGITTILSSWRNLIKKETDEKGVLIVTGDLPTPTDSNSTTVVVDIIRSEKLLNDLPKNFTALDLFNHLVDILRSKKSWPSVQLGNRFMSRVSSLYGDESVDGLNIITLILPATPIVYFGEELGLTDESVFKWGNETDGVAAQKNADESHYKVFDAMIKARHTQTGLFGELSFKVVNESVLMFTRVYLGHPGFLVLYNPSSSVMSLDLSNTDFVPCELTPYIKSIYSTYHFSAEDKFESDAIELEPKSAVVFTFAPRVDDH